jgi:hypothetical protein
MPSPTAVFVVLRLHHRNRLVGVVEQHIVRPFLGTPSCHLAAHPHRPIRKGIFPANLGPLPPGIVEGRGDVAIADIRFAQVFFRHGPGLPQAYLPRLAGLAKRAPHPCHHQGSHSPGGRLLARSGIPKRSTNLPRQTSSAFPRSSYRSIPFG